MEWFKEVFARTQALRKYVVFYCHEIGEKIRLTSGEYNEEEDTIKWKPNCLEIFKTLMGFFKDPNPADDRGDTPLHKAAYGNFELFKIIFENTEIKNPPNLRQETPLHIAASENQPEIVKMILEQVENKSPMDGYGWTPLHFAAARGHFIICQMINQQVPDFHEDVSSSSAALVV